MEALLKKFRAFDPAPPTGGAAEPATPAGDAGEGNVTPRQVRDTARAASHAAATAPHSRLEQANMRAALTVARELM